MLTRVGWRPLPAAPDGEGPRIAQGFEGKCLVCVKMPFILVPNEAKVL